MAETKKATGQKGAAAAAPKKQIIRSPHWPVLTFTEAIQKAKVLYNYEKRNPTTANVLLEHLGFKKRTGPANRTFGALRSYGLIDKTADGKFAVSDRAWRLLVVHEWGSPESDRLVREAALHPPLIKEIVGLYRNGLPSDATLREYLVGTKGFNENTYGQFLKVLKAAIEIAKPFDGAYTPAADDNIDDQEDEEEMNGQEVVVAADVNKKIPPPPPPPAGQLPFPLYLSKDQKAMLYVPATLTRKQYDLLKKQIENSFAVMEATILADEPED